MPPKKKKGGKKGKKSGKSSAKTVTSAVPSEPKLSLEGKSNFLIQTKDLEKQIENLQRECDDLEILNSMFEDKFEQTNVTMEDISDYLQKTITIRTEEISRLNQEFEALQEQRDKENASYEEQISQKKAEFVNIEENLLSEKRMKSGHLASMEEFKVQKEELNQKFEEIKDQIRELDESNAEDIYQREKVAVVQREKLKKEMVSRVNNVATEFRKVSNRQMAETNKKTIRENVDLSDKLKVKSEETLKLLEENERLRSIIDRELKLEIEISQTVENDLQRKHNNNIKEIKQWIEQCRSVEDQLEYFESEEYQENADRIQTENKLLTTRAQTMEEELDTVEAEVKQLKIVKQNKELHLSEVKKNLRMYRRLIQRTKNTLIDVENLTDPAEEYTEGEVLLRRQKLMQSLLELLNASGALGLGMTPIELCATKINT